MPHLQSMHTLLQAARKLGASDIHIKADGLPYLRINGRLVPAEEGPLSLSEFSAFLQASIPAGLRSQWEADRQVDYSYYLPELGRYRVNAFYQRGQLSAVFRVVHAQPPSFESLHMDGQVLSDLCALPDGIIH